MNVLLETKITKLCTYHKSVLLEIPLELEHLYLRHFSRSWTLVQTFQISAIFHEVGHFPTFQIYKTNVNETNLFKVILQCLGNFKS
jgi:hypothetical protein